MTSFGQYHWQTYEMGIHGRVSLAVKTLFLKVQLFKWWIRTETLSKYFQSWLPI